VLRLLRIAVTMWILVVLQTTLVPPLRIAGVGPDLPLLLVLLIALQEGAAGGALAGFLAGLFVDLNAPQTLGLTSLVNSLVAFAVGMLGEHLVRNSALTRLAVALVAVLVRDLGLVLATEPGDLGHLLFRSVIPGAVYTAAIAVPVIAGLEKAVGSQEEPRGRR
jgi:rod shape-determining protein MreD